MDAKAEARPGSGQRGAPRVGPVPCGAGRLLAGLLVVLLPSAPAQPLGAAARRSTQGHGVPGPPRGHCGRTAAGVITDDLWLQKEMKCLGMTALQLPLMVQPSEVPSLILTSAASDDEWSHSIFALIPSWTRKILFKRESSVNHQLTEDVSKLSASSGFGITFQKCAVYGLLLKHGGLSSVMPTLSLNILSQSHGRAFNEKKIRLTGIKCLCGAKTLLIQRILKFSVSHSFYIFSWHRLIDLLRLLLFLSFFFFLLFFVLFFFPHVG